jgi:uncharacterized membrane-anchored protein
MRSRRCPHCPISKHRCNRSSDSSTSTKGHRYADYVAGTDKKAAYGIAGLVAGAMAAKAGFFKLLWVGILAFKKLIIAGVAAAAIGARRLFSRQKPAAPPASA